MKKLIPILLIVLAIALTACSASSTSTSLGTTENGLPIAAQLAVGTIKLVGTDQAVTAEQAKDLVLYWETYKQLSQSDTAAQAEYDGLISQIEETLTADQIQSITDMNITQQDIFTSMQGVTVTTSTSGSSTVSVPSGSSGGAGMPAGGPPSDGGGAPPDGGMGGVAPASDTDQTQSTVASASSGATAGIPTTLIEAVIQSLQQIIAA